MERHVKIPIRDIEDVFVQRIMNQYCVGRNDVRCISAIEYITFEIPALDDELCNEVMAGLGNDGEVIDGCGVTTGGCICRLPKGHESCHICEKCGEEWETKVNKRRV
jgi:hypothetical protein